MFENVLIEFAALAGFSAFVSVLVNVLKVVKIGGVPIIQDGTSDKWIAGANLVGVLALYAVRLFIPDFNPIVIDSTLQQIALIGAYIMSYVSMLLGSKLTYIATKGLPVIGKSFSDDGAG